MESTHCSTARAIVRHVRAWPRRLRLALLAAFTLAALLTVLSLPPISQAQAYHNFADQRGLLGVPHFLNVVSNAVFVLDAWPSSSRQQWLVASKDPERLRPSCPANARAKER